MDAADASGPTNTGDPSEMGESESSDQGDQTFFLPDSFPGRENYKAGDTITLKVVGEDADGDLEVECVHPKGGEKDWKTDLRESVPNTPSGDY